MIKSLNGCASINVEISSICHKNCFCCGRRSSDRKAITPINYGHMPLDLMTKIADQIPNGITVQLHWNGEPTEHPQLADALKIFHNNFTNFVTNGLLLAEKATDIIGNVDTISISIIENEDPVVRIQQYESIVKFLGLKGTDKPFTSLRFVGHIENPQQYYELDLPIVKRILHRPEGSFGYTKETVKPETMVCLEMLHKLAIDRFGNVSPCVRYDPEGKMILGNVNNDSLYDIWNSFKRHKMVAKHITGRRGELEFCGKHCDYYGNPRGD